MDRLDAMTVFVAVVDEGSLAAAARRLGWSAAAVTRAIKALERRHRVRLLNRTTRVVRVTEAGERFAATCRTVLAELTEVDQLGAGPPRGMLTVSAPLMFGRLQV